MNALFEQAFAGRTLPDFTGAPSPLPSGIPEAAEALYRYKNRKAFIVCDFDADGVFSGIVLYAGLSRLGFDAELAPCRPQDGYGFTVFRAEEILMRADACTSFVITADVGIADVQAADFLLGSGMPVIVTDHHLPGERLPACPCADFRLGDYPPGHEVCGAQTAQMLLSAYAACFDPDALFDIERLRVFSGIGAAADVMPVFGKAREDIRFAASACSVLMSAPPSEGADAYSRAFAALSEFLDFLRLSGKLAGPASVTEETFGFYIAPMINALKRTDGEILAAFSAFFSNKDERARARRYLAERNEMRKRWTRQWTSLLYKEAQPFAPILYYTDAPAGVRGLIAAKLSDRTGLPALVAGRDGRGSGRSPEAFPGTLHRIREAGGYAAGHPGAFGFRLNRHQAERFAASLSDEQPSCTSAEPSYFFSPEMHAQNPAPCVYTPELYADYFEDLRRLRPFGRGFPLPEGALVFDSSQAKIQRMGKSGGHLKYVFPSGLTALCWNQGEAAELTGLLAVLGHPSRNRFAGRLEDQFTGEVFPGEELLCRRF